MEILRRLCTILVMSGGLIAASVKPSHAVLITFDDLTGTVGTYSSDGLEFGALGGGSFGPLSIPGFLDKGIEGATTSGAELSVTFSESESVAIKFTFGVTTKNDAPGGKVMVRFFDSEGFAFPGTDEVFAQQTGNENFHMGIVEIEKDAQAGLSGRKLNSVTLDFETVGGSRYFLDNFEFRSLSVIPGDVDGSGTLDLKDAILPLQIVSAVPPASPVTKGADVNLDGKIGEEEALYILQRISAGRGVE